MNQIKLIKKFESFQKELSNNLTAIIEKMLKSSQVEHEKIYSIAFNTSDDFYGMYITYEYESSKNQNIWENFQWDKGVAPPFMYQSLVDIVDHCDLNLMVKSEEKWMFAKVLMDVLHKSIETIPNESYMKYGYKREDILFFITMSDGDYMDEMLIHSAKLFNQPEVYEKYNLE